MGSSRAPEPKNSTAYLKIKALRNVEHPHIPPYKAMRNILVDPRDVLALIDELETTRYELLEAEREIRDGAHTREREE